jgi:dsRNA-specific ribonuclease
VGKSPQAIDYVLACCFEAVIGAVFLDSDYHYEVVNQVLATIFGIPAIEKRLRNNGADPTGHNVVEKGLPKSNKPPEPIVALEPEDAKGRLRQLVRKILGQDDVDFSVFRRDQGRVIVEAKVGEVSLGKGQGKNIAAASENAAEIILKRTQGLTVNLPQALRKEEPSM